MKLEWKRQEKEIYGVNTKPCVIDIPVQKYIIISGSGNPNGEIFSGKCIQVLHKGAFDDEPLSFELMNDYCLEHGYKRMGKEHREIYLNNANRTEKANLKTILRYKVTDIGK